MKSTSISHLKNHLSAHLKEVMAGEPVMITDRRKPIAILRPWEAEETDAELAGLIHQGIVHPPAQKLNVKAFLKAPRVSASRSLSEAILEEREAR